MEAKFCFAGIEKNDSIIIHCLSPDESAMPVGDVYIWIAKVVSIKVSSVYDDRAVIKARIYYNTEKDITKPLKLKKKAEVMEVDEASILDVFAEELTILSSENISVIVSSLGNS